MNLSLSGSSYKRNHIIQYLSFSVWCILLCIVFESSSMLLHISEFLSFLRLNNIPHSHFVYPFIRQWVFGLLPSLTIVNYAFMGIGISDVFFFQCNAVNGWYWQNVYLHFIWNTHIHTQYRAVFDHRPIFNWCYYFFKFLIIKSMTIFLSVYDTFAHDSFL